MAHTVNFNPDLRIIELKITGEYSIDEARQATSEVIQVIKETNCFLTLTDLREAKLQLSTIELYEAPQVVETKFRQSDILVQQVKRAVVTLRGNNDVKFFENVSTTRGHRNIKIFTDVETAIAWLLE